MLYIALPALNELENLPGFISALSDQSLQEYRLMVCINQPDEWWSIPGKKHICDDNQDAIAYLHALNDKRIAVIDKSSAGKGWHGKNHGIGWARKTLMDAISEIAAPSDIIVSLDADTLFRPKYLESIQQNLSGHPGAMAVSVPYYHPLTGEEVLDRAMLRYEIYMRCYSINLWRIKSPYCFTALGSAISLPVKAYRLIGGMTPKMSGEDFYFLQKLVKCGTLLQHNDEIVYPSARLSDRVYFGTGPALIKGISGDWESYPIYSCKWFGDIENLYRLFPLLFKATQPTPLDDFFTGKFGKLPWEELRTNYKTEDQFVRACHSKFDGLRILQYLKERQHNEMLNDEQNLEDFLSVLQKEFPAFSGQNGYTVSFTSGIDNLNTIRNFLFNVELKYRENSM